MNKPESKTAVLPRDLRAMGYPVCDRAATEIERLRDGIQAMLDGNYPNPRSYRSAPGMKCPHGQPYYEECEQCNEDWLTGLLSGAKV